MGLKTIAPQALHYCLLTVFALAHTYVLTGATLRPFINEPFSMQTLAHGRSIISCNAHE